MNHPLTGSIERAARLHAKEVRARLLGGAPRKPVALPKRPIPPKPAPVPRDVIRLGPDQLNPIDIDDPTPPEMGAFDYVPVGQRILAEICAKHKTNMRELRSPRRNTYIVRARQEAAYRLVNEAPHLSLPAIGRMLNRDHTTILHSVRAYKKRMAEQEEAA